MGDRSTEMVEAVTDFARAVARVERLIAQQQVSSEPWIDVATAAVHAQCGEDTIRDVIATGTLPAVRNGARGILGSDIDRALTSCAPLHTLVKDSANVVAGILRSLESGG